MTPAYDRRAVMMEELLSICRTLKGMSCELDEASISHLLDQLEIVVTDIDEMDQP